MRDFTRSFVFRKNEFLNKFITVSIQGVSRLVDITAGGDFLGLCDQKVRINMCPILDGYGVMTA